jgi:hypothetical protein
MRKRIKKGYGRKLTCCKCGKIKENPVDGYCKTCRNICAKKNRVKHSELPFEERKKANARCYLNAYLKRGKIIKNPCFCGSWDVEAHHEDYNKPLEVIWLCREHHLKHHGVDVKNRTPKKKREYKYDKNEKENDNE